MKNTLIVLLLSLFSVQFALAQVTVSGNITDENGVPLPGATVIEVGTNNGVSSDFDGNYSITVAGTSQLEFSFVGYVTVVQDVNSQDTINVSLAAAGELEEVVVSGVAGATSKKKLSVTVATLSAEEIEAVPASSAAGALLGKVAGVNITNLGRPGAGSTIILRGAANFYGSQEPLVIIDGVYVEGGLSDINIDDIDSFEIVKGASAASLYGSRAGNGVIVISSKRGKKGKTEITFRNEIGYNEITRTIPVNQSHGFVLASDWQSFQGQYTKLDGVTYPAGFASVYAAGGAQGVGGSPIQEADGYHDNPFGVYNDHHGQLFTKGNNQTTYLSVSSGSERSRTFFSFENYSNEGVVALNDGYDRRSFRLNSDFFITDNLTLNTSSNFITVDDSPSVGGGIFRTFTRLSPDANLLLDNPDGQPYWYTPDPHESEITNPLYAENIRDYKTQNERFLGAYNLQYNFNSNLNLVLAYSFENNSYRYTDVYPYESYTITAAEVGFGYSKGSMTKYSNHEKSQVAQATLNFSKEFGELDVRAKLFYQAEDRAWESMTARGNDFLYKDLPSLDNFDPSTISIASNRENVRAQSYSGIANLIYMNRYIFEGLYRQDGSSLFGADARWNDYYRVSAAYRISEDVQIPGIDELKLNFALGTSGQRPGFTWQYEQTGISGGTLSSNRIKGNSALRPSETTETEIGLNVDFLDRFSLEAAYSIQETTDQFMLVSLFAPANAGKNRQWQNVGDLEATTLEAQLDFDVLTGNPNMSWNIGVNYSASEAEITKLNAPKQTVGTGGLFRIDNGMTWGDMYGRVILQGEQGLADLASQLGSGDSISNYSINSDGVVVETAAIGTADEKGIIKKDASGTDVQEVIGNQEADFRVGLVSNFRYKNFGVYMLWDWKQGGDVYNGNGQWNTIALRNAIVDQAGKDANEKKHFNYYGSLYDVNQNNNWWVEDASYVKLRELALTYNVPKAVLVRTGLVDSAKISLIGRNILTITDYLGWDPEVTSYSSGTQQYFAFDQGVYPTQSSYSLSLQLKF